MLAKIIFTASFFFTAFALNCLDVVCDDLKHYKEMGCKPVIEEGKCCPTRFDCPENKDENKCHLNGKSYSPGDSIPDEDIEGISCTAACRCNDGDDVPDFRCAQFDCPPTSFPHPDNNDDDDDDDDDEANDCVRQDDKGSCCATGYVCGQNKTNLATCYIDGDKHYEGERMYPNEESCYACICSKDFDNSTIIGNKDCWEINCGIQVHYARQLQTGCAPIYYGKGSCCPIGWNCPDEKVKIIPNAKSAPIDDDNLKCKYGKHLMNLGDSISSEDTCVTCKCTVPPKPHCVQDPLC